MPWTDGQSLVPLLQGKGRTEPGAHGILRPKARSRRWWRSARAATKFVHCEIDPPALFDLESDPAELANLAGDPAQADRVAEFMAKVRAPWDMDRFDAEVRESQARRLGRSIPRFATAPTTRGIFQPLQKAFGTIHA